MTCRSDHAADCLGGWTPAVELDGSSSSVRPCEACQPGKYAVFKAGYRLADNWKRNPEALRIYNAAQLAAGQPAAEAPREEAKVRDRTGDYA